MVVVIDHLLAIINYEVMSSMNGHRGSRYGLYIDLLWGFVRPLIDVIHTCLFNQLEEVLIYKGRKVHPHQ